MNNEITNELANYREGRILGVKDEHVTPLVFEEMQRIAPGSPQGLQGVDCGGDGLTRPLWDAAVYTAGQNGTLVFGEAALTRHDLTGVQPVIYSDAVRFIANRVAMAILVIHGYISAPR